MRSQNKTLGESGLAQGLGDCGNEEVPRNLKNKFSDIVGEVRNRSKRIAGGSCSSLGC